MKFVCPDKNNKDWQSLVALVGLNKAYKAFIKNDYNIPKIEREITDELGQAVVEALKVTTLRLKLLEGKASKTGDVLTESKRLKDTESYLVDSLVNGKHKEGLLYFAQQMTEDIEVIKRYISNTAHDTKLRSARIRSAVRYIDSVIPIIEDINKFLVDKTLDKEEQEIFEILSSKRSILEKLRDDSIESGRDIMLMLLEPILGQRNDPKLLAEINKNLPENKKIKEFDLLESMKYGDKDINMLDRWLKSLANSPDELLKLVNELVLRKKAEARLKALEDKYELLDIREKYFRAGGKNFDWVYEVRRDGTTTGNFIDERRWNEYYHDLYEFKKKFINDLGYEYLHQLDTQQKVDYLKAINKWKDDNSDVVTEQNQNNVTVRTKKPSLAKYGNADYAKLSSLEKDILERLKKMKLELDEKIHPKFRNPNLTPQVSKDFLQRFTSVKNMNDVAEIFAGSVYGRDYDIDKGNISNVDEASVTYVLSDRGEEQGLLPMHFTRKLENLDRDLSKDIISSMVVYSHMARDYETMDEIIDSLEVMKDIMKERKVRDTDFGGKIKKTVKYIAGTRIYEDLFKTNNLAYDRFADFMNMIVYGKTRVEGGKILGMDREKFIDLIGKYTAINNLALNVYAGIANLGTGESTLGIEAIAGNYGIDKKSLTKGTADYFAHTPEFLAQIGNVHNTSKLALYTDKYDPLQDYQSNMHETDSNRRTWLARSFKLSSLFFMSKAGEHFIQVRGSLALANSTMLRDKNGKEISLFDAQEVKNGRLVFKEGITKLDGTQWTRDDDIAFMRRQDFLNQRMHGIYNKNDMAAIQKYALGRLAMMFRKFIIPGMDRRWEKANYNYMLGDFTEGYYNTAGRFLIQLGRDLKHFQFSIVKNWNNLSPMEKSNMTRFMSEMAYVLSLSILLAFFLGGDDDDEINSDEWLQNMMEYQAKRIRTELMFFLNPVETLRIVQNPMAATSTVGNFFTFLSTIINPLAWDEKYESGRYEDWYKWQKRGLILLPFYKTIDRAAHPEEVLRFFSNQ